VIADGRNAPIPDLRCHRSIRLGLTLEFRSGGRISAPEPGADAQLCRPCIGCKHRSSRNVAARSRCEASAATAQIEERLTLLDDALQIVERTGVRWFAAELNRLKGQLLLRQGHSEAAEELYRKALSVAEEQGAKLWELPPRASPGCAATRGAMPKRATCSRRSMAGSPKASARPISKRQKRCSTN
jgi:hypothetical protein